MPNLIVANLLPYKYKGKIEAGCDEAGRGCLAGPVVAAAVILPSDFKHKLLNDSKKLTEKQRDLAGGVHDNVQCSPLHCHRCRDCRPKNDIGKLTNR